MNIFLAINKDGSEISSNHKLFRYSASLDKIIKDSGYENNISYIKYMAINDHWCDTFSTGHYTVPKFTGVVLPKGTIYKLTGIQLKWDDKPINLIF